MIVFVVVLGSMILALASCGGAVKGNSSGLPWSAPEEDSEDEQEPDTTKESSGTIAFNTESFHLSRIIGDVDAARMQGATQDTAVLTSVDELVTVDYAGAGLITTGTTSISVNATEIWAEDFTGDGADDLLAGGSGTSWGEPAVSLVTQSGSTFQEEDAILTYMEVTSLFPFYLDYYDDAMDIVATDKVTGYLMGEYSASGDLGPMHYESGASNMGGDVYHSCAAKDDMDGNGREDMVLTIFGKQRLEVHFGYEAWIDWDSFDEENPLESYDMRGLHAAKTTGKRMPVIPEDSTATDDPVVLDLLDQGMLVLTPYRVALGDFNGDLLPDVALLCRALEGNMPIEIATITYYTNSFVVILTNNGVPEGKTECTLTFTLSQAVAIGPASEDIGAADFDQDDNLDLVVAVSGAPFIATARGLGDGTFEEFEYHSTGGRHTYRLALGDFDSEDGVDAVMTCPLEQSLVFFMNNSEIVSEPVP